jgi:dTDP-4-amino-4,6-dideoxy-D-galactose acyltransferase
MTDYASSLAGPPGCELLEWDTAFFGIRIARVKGYRLRTEYIDPLFEWCARHEVECLYFLADPTDRSTAQLCERHGFRFVDVRSTFQRVLPEDPEPAQAPGSFVIREYHAEDLPDLEAIARESFHDTRFYFDRGFSDDRCDDLYASWVRKECQSRTGKVFVAAADASSVGFITCLPPVDEERTGWISLLATKQALRRRGVGQLLIHRALTWFERQGARRVRVATQGRNIAGQRAYIRAGFNLQDWKIWYHRWFPGGEI